MKELGFGQKDVVSFDSRDGSYYRGFDGQMENELGRPLNHCLSKSVHSKISPTRPSTLELEIQR